MREIRFRAWDGKEVHHKLFSLDIDSNNNFTEVSIWPDNEDIPTKLGCTHKDCNLKDFYGDIELMQYIGLKDKNDKEIYEGDIVKTPNGGRLIKWWQSGFVMRTLEDDITNDLSGFTNSYESMPRCEVIGNIHENPELLTKE